MGDRPFFSICIPAYNVADYVIDCLESITAQTCRDWEIVIIDDGSTDDTLSIIGSWARECSNPVRVKSMQNRGLYAARGVAYELAQGEIIINVDSDDLLVDVDALHKLQEAFRDDTVDMVLFNASRSMKRPIQACFDYSGLISKYGHTLCREDLLEAFALGRVANAIWLKAFRSSLFTGNLSMPCKINLGEDRLRLATLLGAVRKAVILDEVFYFYRQNDESITHQVYDSGKIEQECIVEQQVFTLHSAWCISRQESMPFFANWLYIRLRRIFLCHEGRAERVALYRKLCESDFCTKMTGDAYTNALHTVRERLLLWLVKRKWLTAMDFLLYMKGKGVHE